jgi:hypothetical protein
MSTVAEIETAIEKLPIPQQEEIFAFLALRSDKRTTATLGNEDPFAALIGAYAGPREATGRNAEDVLYGRGA